MLDGVGVGAVPVHIPANQPALGAAGRCRLEPQTLEHLEIPLIQGGPFFFADKEAARPRFSMPT